jgi:hypothetical protein
VLGAIIIPVTSTKYTGPCGCIVIWSILPTPETHNLHHSRLQLQSVIHEHPQHIAVLFSSAVPASTVESILV